MRRLIKFLIWTLILAVVVYTALWHFAAYMVNNNGLAFINQRLGPVRTFEAQELKATGFPFSFRIEADRPLFTDSVEGMTYGADQPVAGRINLLSPTTLRLALTGSHQATLPDGRLIDADIIADRLDIISNTDGDVTAFEADVKRLDVAMNGRPAMVAEELMAYVETGIRGNAEIDLTLGSLNPSAFIAGMIPIDPQNKLIQGLTAVTVKGRSANGLPDMSSRETALIWQRGGGEMMLDEFTFSLASATLSLNGRAWLNDDLSPGLDARLQGDGLETLIDDLFGSGIIDFQQMLAAKFSISPLMKPSDDGTRRMDARLVIENGQLKLGNFALPVPKLFN